MIAGTTVLCTSCGVQTYGCRTNILAIRAWSRGEVDTRENRIQRRREEEMRIWRMISPEPELRAICDNCHRRRT